MDKDKRTCNVTNLGQGQTRTRTNVGQGNLLP